MCYKIYLDAFEAKTWAFQFLQYLLKFLHCDNPSIVLRLFLASSRAERLKTLLRLMQLCKIA
jgi:hypothetical protein